MKTKRTVCVKRCKFCGCLVKVKRINEQFGDVVQLKTDQIEPEAEYQEAILDELVAELVTPIIMYYEGTIPGEQYDKALGECLSRFSLARKKQ